MAGGWNLESRSVAVPPSCPGALSDRCPHPQVGVPLPHFALGTLLGCMPNNFVAVSAGCRLGELRSLADLYDRKLLVVVLGIAAVALAPIAWKHRHERRAAAAAAAARKQA